MNRKLLITGALKKDKLFFDKIAGLGYEIIYFSNETESFKAHGFRTDEIEGIICNGFFLYNDIGEFFDLKWIQLTSAGYDRVPLDYINKRNIKIYNARGVYSIPIAEYAISGILQIYKHCEYFRNNQKRHKWEKCRELMELYGKSVCIVGCGNVGAECAKRFAAFGCAVFGVDITEIRDEIYTEKYSLEKIDEAFAKSDIVVLTLPLTKETENFMNIKRFSAMKENSIFVNISRGKTVDEEALINAIQNRLYGAVLDVFANEPLNENSLLWGLENVIITPHNSFVGEGNETRLRQLILENISEL